MNPSRTCILEGSAFQNFERNRFCDHQKNNFVRCFEMPTAPKPEFWQGERFKTSNENASATPSEAISFEVFKCEPFQNLYSGRVGVAKHRTELQIRARLGTVCPRAQVHPRQGRARAPTCTPNRAKRHRALTKSYRNLDLDERKPSVPSE